MTPDKDALRADPENHWEADFVPDPDHTPDKDSLLGFPGHEADCHCHAAVARFLLAEARTDTALRAAAMAYMNEVTSLGCDHDGSGAGTHTSCPPALALRAALAAAEAAPPPHYVNMGLYADRVDYPAEAAPLDVERRPLAEAVIDALDVYGTMGNGEGWTMERDVIGTLWRALTQEEKAKTGYNVAEMDARIARAEKEVK